MNSQHQQNRPYRAGMTLHAWLIVFVSTTTAGAADGPITPATSCPASGKCARPLDSLWVVSSRHLCCPDQCPLEEVDLRVWQCDNDANCEASEIHSLAEAARNSTTVIYVPGNRTDWSVAIQEGSAIYESLLHHGSAEPITFVIWSWPSDRLLRPIKDLRVKALRTNCEGPYLAWLLARLDERAIGADPKISLIGYSYGARCILGALHVWNGGQLACVRLANGDTASDTRVRAVFLAPATHSHWLQPGCVYGRAYGRIDHALSLNNSCDEDLRRYHVVEKHGHPRALGYEGLWGRPQFSDGAERFHEYDACGHVGRSHSFENYLYDDVLAEKIARYALWGDAHPY